MRIYVYNNTIHYILTHLYTIIYHNQIYVLPQVFREYVNDIRCSVLNIRSAARIARRSVVRSVVRIVLSAGSHSGDSPSGSKNAPKTPRNDALDCRMAPPVLIHSVIGLRWTDGVRNQEIDILGGFLKTTSKIFWPF